MFLSIEDNIAKLRQAIALAEKKYQREHDSVQLIAVSKTKPATMLRQAAAAGQRHFAENYVQKGVEKVTALAELGLTWHFIGPLQSNKTRPVAAHFDWVHTVDRLKIARRLSEQRPEQLPPLNICLQVNICGSDEKSGATIEQLPELAAAVAALPRLQLRGLMTIPRASNNEAEQRHYFGLLADALNRLQTDHPQLDQLSMGMSGDMDAAIAEGATMVRIGTAIFGARGN